jgi:hypothetical protein
VKRREEGTEAVDVLLTAAGDDEVQVEDIVGRAEKEQNTLMLRAARAD